MKFSKVSRANLRKDQVELVSVKHAVIGNTELQHGLHSQYASFNNKLELMVS
jgi:hypothetical protein